MKTEAFGSNPLMSTSPSGPFYIDILFRGKPNRYNFFCKKKEPSSKKLKVAEITLIYIYVIRKYQKNIKFNFQDI